VTNIFPWTVLVLCTGEAMAILIDQPMISVSRQVFMYTLQVERRSARTLHYNSVEIPTRRSL